MLRLSQWLKDGLQCSVELLKIVGMLTAMLLLVLPFAALWIALFFVLDALLSGGALLWLIVSFVGLYGLRRYLVGQSARKAKRKSQQLV